MAVAAKGCECCAGSGRVDAIFSSSWYSESARQEVCPECLGSKLAPRSDDFADEPEPDAVCACGASPVVAVVDGWNRCAVCVSDVSASFARSEDSGVDLLSGFSPSARRHSRAAV